MQVWLRLLVVWFIAVALPVQGIAGVAMAHCGAPPDRRASAEAPLHPHAAHGAEAGHRHGDHAQQGGHHCQSAASGAQPGQRSDLSPHKCSACASCCAGTALTSAPPRVPEPTFAAPVFAFALVAVDAFASDGPDRPPRTPLV